MMPDYTTRVTKANFDKFMKDPLSKVVVFSDKPKASALVKALAAKYEGRLTFGVCGSNDKGLVAMFGPTEFPAVFVVPKVHNQTLIPIYT